MATGDRVPAGTRGESMDPLSGLSRLDGVRVLVVEGEPQVRQLVVDVLGQCGARVTAVDSAAQGLAMLKQETPDALVSSLSLPDQNGYWLIREIRKLPPDQGGDIPAAAFTGASEVEDQRHALRAGFQVHLSKPADLRKLAEVVAALSQKQSAAARHGTPNQSWPGGRS
jgi:CheY-like chemotaxis protein